MPITPSGPVLVKINKKTGENTYTLYYPQTDAQYVLYAPEVISDPDFTALTHYNKYGEAVSGGAYLHVDDVLDVIFKALNNVSNVLEFKGVKALYSDLGTASAGTVGDVWVVNQAHGTYPAGTLYVGATDGAAEPTYSWEPLGGNNTIYATKAEALNTVTLSGSTFTFKYVDDTDSAPNRFNITIPTVGTTEVNTTGVVTSIPATGSDTSIPNVKAVRDFAGSAGKLNTTTATADTSYYVVAVNSSTGATNQTPYDMGLEIKRYATPITGSGAAGWINVQVAQANRLTNGLQIGSIWYDGTDAVTVSAGAGITISTSTNAATIGLSASGVASGTYSAVQVDIYGRATAGGQSVVFANSLDDPDLNQLVVGGLAFVSTNETAKDSGTVPTNSINLNN